LWVSEQTAANAEGAELSGGLLTDPPPTRQPAVPAGLAGCAAGRWRKSIAR